MSDNIVVLPVGGSGVAAIGEHLPHPEREGRHHNDDHPAEDHPRRDEPKRGKSRQPPPPPVDDPGVPAETLFTATLISTQMGRLPPSPSELRLRTGGTWTPPDSQFHLKDKLI